MIITQLDLFATDGDDPDTYGHFDVLVYRGRSVAGGWGQGGRGLTLARVLAAALTRADAYNATRIEINGRTEWTR
jgi:hypothetical protein